MIKINFDQRKNDQWEHVGDSNQLLQNEIIRQCKCNKWYERLWNFAKRTTEGV